MDVFLTKCFVIKKIICEQHLIIEVVYQPLMHVEAGSGLRFLYSSILSMS